MRRGGLAVSRFLLLAAALGLAAVLATLLLDSAAVRSLGSSGELEIGFVTPFRYDSLGNDLDAENGEVVTLWNQGDRTIDVSGWVLNNEEGVAYEFPEGFSLAPGGQVAIHTGCGEDSTTDLYWCSRRPLWNDRGGVASLSTPDGRQVAAYRYGGCASCSM
jgi:hypothetical protein